MRTQDNALNCTNPQKLLVYPLGSKFKKDGTPGRKVRFGETSWNYAPEVLTQFGLFAADDSVDYKTGEVAVPYLVPCGKCLACRQNHAHEWKLRLLMEGDSLPPEKRIFLTLTYDDAFLPFSKNCRPNLDYKDFQRFIDNLKHLLKRSGEAPELRYFVSGEYGDQTERPHFHVLLFGYDFFKYAKFAGKSKSGAFLFTNDFIDRAWHKGLAEFGDASQSSMMYTAQYAVKKLVDEFDADDRKPPFVQMSRRPGIGHDYIIKHKNDILHDKGAYIGGQFVPMNRYMVNVLLAEGDFSELDKYKLSKIREELAFDKEASFEYEHPGQTILSHDRDVSDVRLRQMKEQKILNNSNL